MYFFPFVAGFHNSEGKTGLIVPFLAGETAKAHRFQ